jgi:hypothetical protein
MRNLPRLTVVTGPLAAALFEHQINIQDDLEYPTFCLRRWHSVHEAEERLAFSTFDPTIVRNNESPKLTLKREGVSWGSVGWNSVGMHHLLQPWLSG